MHNYVEKEDIRVCVFVIVYHSLGTVSKTKTKSLYSLILFLLDMGDR